MGLRGPLAKLYDEQHTSERTPLAPPPKYTPPTYKNMTVNLPIDTLEELREFAFRHRMRQNEVVRQALQEYMKTNRD